MSLNIVSKKISRYIYATILNLIKQQTCIGHCTDNQMILPCLEFGGHGHGGVRLKGTPDGNKGQLLTAGAV